MLQARARLLLLLPVLSLSYSLSSNTPFSGETRQHINQVKFRIAVINDNLTHWLHATSTGNGFYQTNLN